MRNTKITSETVKKMASLARLPLTKDEIETFTHQLAKVIDYFSVLDLVDTSNVNPTYHPIESQKNIFKDESNPDQTLSQSQTLQNALNTQNGYITTDKVLDK